MKKETLTIKDAYLVILHYLNFLWETTAWDNLGAYILSDMKFAADGIPMDSACWSDWLDAIKTIKDISSEEETLTPKQAYKALLYCLEVLYKNTTEKDLGELLSGMRLNAEGSPMDPVCWQNWLNAWKAIQNMTPQEKAAYGYLQWLE